MLHTKIAMESCCSQLQYLCMYRTRFDVIPSFDSEYLHWVPLSLQPISTAGVLVCWIKSVAVTAVYSICSNIAKV